MTESVIHVNAGYGYDVTIGYNLLPRCGDIIAKSVRPCRAAVITDSNVGPLYLDTVMEGLRSAGFEPVSYTFPAGERSKNLTTLSEVLELMADAQLTRSDMAVALGGGVTGDITGFAAGCYLRGISYIQIPTTLLAAVDSSVGGKTAVDLDAGKNLAGLFLQPRAVICDMNTLDTLSDDVFADGAAEAIKTGVLMGEPLFSLLESTPVRAWAEDVIGLCVAHKASVVERDEREEGLRKTLNLGHTAGHAIEKLSGYSISHGHAVAAGLGIIARASAKLGICNDNAYRRIESLLTRAGLPVTASYSAASLAEAALTDKKRGRDGITLVMPEDIGSCVLRDIPFSELDNVFSAGLEV